MWGELFDEVYGYLRRLGASHFDAEEIAQDALEAAYLHVDGIAPGTLRAWLKVVARNKLVDRARRAARSVPTAEPPDPGDWDADPMNHALKRAQAERIRKAIDALGQRDRELIELRYLEERTLAETAGAVGASVANTKVALYRARQRLRHVLERMEGSR